MPKPGDWKCLICDRVLYSWKTVCTGLWRYHEPVMKKDGILVPVPGTWDCKGCTSINFPDQAKCFRCSKPRESLEKRAGDWDCERCGSLNFSSRVECFRCSKPPVSSGECSKPLEKRAGDWDCEGCGVNNFASRVECFKCKSPRIREDDELCVVCFAAPKTHGFLHGSSVHNACCEKCSKMVSGSCPICRQPIDKVIKVFD